MSNVNYKSFKSGTDIRGVAVETPGSPVTLTDETVKAMAAGFGRWLCGRNGKTPGALKIAVGHDSRVSAGRISRAVEEALTDMGFTVFDCGLSSTPAMFMITVDGGADAAVQITASHHPFDRNGLKFFTPGGGLEGEEITEILDLAAKGEVQTALGGRVIEFDYMPRYAELLRQMICRALGKTEEDAPLAGFHFVVDAGNGAGGFYASDVLERLGADLSGSQFLEPDGMFPNHIPNPENPAAMESIRKAAVDNHADLGIIFDTDVDRAGCVDASGEEINRNVLIALAASIALEGNPGGTIVTDSVTSDGLKTFIEQTLGGVHHRFKRGYKNVINEAVRLNKQGVNCPLAIETSGHAALRENYFLDDGAYLITKIIIKLAALRTEGKTLDDLIGGLSKPAEEAELRFSILAPDFCAYGERVLKELEAYCRRQAGWTIAGDNREGLRVSVDGGDGWFLLRMSVHDPILPMNLESNLPGGVRKTAAALLDFFAGFDRLDITPLHTFLAEKGGAAL
ncbi:MAG: phosphomannomutase/phosphoglucomutase [Candidatus Howiella sp.]|jgi:phosphomannomutase